MFVQRELRPNIAETLGGRWCRLMHAAPMWPINGRYQCRKCGRTYLVPWAGEQVTEPAQLWIQQEEPVLKRAA